MFQRYYFIAIDLFNSLSETHTLFHKYFQIINPKKARESI